MAETSWRKVFCFLSFRISYLMGTKHSTCFSSRNSLALSSLPKVALMANHRCSSVVIGVFASADIEVFILRHILLAPRD